MKTTLLALGFWILALALAGCTIYRYTPERDSAYVQGWDEDPDTSLLHALTSGWHLTLQLVDIDGALVIPGSGKYLSPGRHSILIECSDPSFYQMVYPEEGGIPVAVICPVRDRVEAVFEKNHTYQFTFEPPFHVTLWDNTAGQHVSVAHWVFAPVDYRSDKTVPSDAVAAAGSARPSD